MKKIVFSSFTKYPSESVGGPNKIIYQIIKRLNKDSFNVEFMSADYKLNSDQIKNLIEDHFRFNTIKKMGERFYNKYFLARKLFTSSLYLKYYFFKKHKKWSLINDEGDILHSHDSFSFYYLYKNFNRKLLTIHSKGRIVDDLTDFFPQLKNNKKLLENLNQREIESIKNAEVIVFPSNAAKELFFEKMSEKELKEKSLVIHNGVDVKLIQSIELKPEHLKLKEKNKKLFLTVSKLSKFKRVDLIIKSIKELKEKKFPAKLIIIGEGPLENELKQLCEKLQLTNDVIFMSSKRNDDVISLMKCADAFIMASEKVIFDMVVLEALACGCRVIVNKDGGNCEIIDDGVNGHLVDIKSSTDLAEKIFSIDYEKNLDYSETWQKIDIENMFNNYLNLYK